MGNLGLYQDIVVAAKNMGGVPKLITSIQRAAVAQAAPGLLAIGAAGGAVLVGVGAVGVKVGRNAWAEHARRIAEGEAAEAVLTDLIEGNTDDAMLDQRPDASPRSGSLASPKAVPDRWSLWTTLAARPLQRPRMQ